MDKLNRIVDEIKAKQCVIFIGAGISKIAGCDLWDELIKKIENDNLIKNNTNPAGLENEDREVIMQYYKNIFFSNKKDNVFWKYIRELIYFINKEEFYGDYQYFINTLKKIDPFPRVILTTNFDHYLETSKLVPMEQVYGKNANIKYKKNLEGLFHIHGSLEDGIKELVITSNQYEERYKDNNFTKFLKDIAKNNSILFLGYSLERDIKSILNEVKQSGKKHYLLLSSDSIKKFNTGLYESEWGVNLVDYGDLDNFIKEFELWVNGKFQEKALSIFIDESDVSNITN